MYDLIGDIHGFADTLELMLEKLGYKLKKGIYTHPKRMVIFTGDFIDRGPKIRKTLQIVRSMIDAGTAQSVAGNHEFNAIGFHTKDSEGKFLRPHTKKNIQQFSKTLNAFKNYPNEWNDYIEWFKKLPITIEKENLRVVHACWDFRLIKILKNKFPKGLNNKKFIMTAFTKGSIQYEITETLLKGKEIILPKGIFFKDKDKHIRYSIRYRWWKNLKNETYKTAAVSKIYDLPDIPIPNSLFNDHQGYDSSEKPLFFGHYWRSGTPNTEEENICCLDYSLGKCKQLTAYRFDGESKLNNSKFITVNCVDKV